MSAKRTPDLGGTPELPIAQSTPAPAQGNPLVQTGTEGHSFHTQFAFDVNKQIGKLEVCVQHLEERLGKMETKVDRLQDDVTSIKTTIKTFEPMISKAITGIWAIFWTMLTGLAGAGITILIMWLKHHNGW